VVIEIVKAKILEDLSEGNYRFTIHAFERMRDRKLTDVDISNISNTCQEFMNLKDGTYRVTGHRLNGNGISVICKIESNTVIITVMKRRIKGGKKK
jgi:hypothetical protein